MFVKTKEELLEYIKGLTDGFRGEEPERFTASENSARLNVSRNLTSQYLNELVKDGLLVKANLRPVYFFHKGMLEAQYDATVAQPAFDSLRELAAHLSVSTATVEAAYARLISEGLCESRPRSGIYALEQAQRVGLTDGEKPPVRWNFGTGAADAAHFPYATWARLMREVLSEQSATLLRSGVRTIQQMNVFFIHRIQFQDIIIYLVQCFEYGRTVDKCRVTQYAYFCFWEILVAKRKCIFYDFREMGMCSRFTVSGKCQYIGSGAVCLHVF